ncbi:MAG: hypothetical protein PWP58_948 [Bacillota bacterium]|jgi:predicted nucleic acid-binding protein|nr:hypothetical protein [Bacillota bacterium]MDK2785318.1 hypothetical protein [Bacillota bacterium]MDK2882612.1 hypothetical protein [Bacillota bacterium]
MSATNRHFFVDTNVLVYAYDLSAGPKHTKAADLLTGLWKERTGCLSIQVLQEFFVTITRKAAHPLPVDKAAQIISDLATWRVHQPGIPDVLMAIEISRRNLISFWDALIIESAVKLKCDVVFSEDLNPGQTYEGVKIVNPFAT